VLIRLGYETDLWQVPNAVITDELRTRVTRTAPLDDLLRSVTPTEPYEVIVLPYVVEAAREEPAVLLSRLAGWLGPEGAMVAGIRLRVAESRLGRIQRAGRPAAFSLSWPTLPAVRTPEFDEVRAWFALAGLHVREGGHVIDRTATVPIRAMTIRNWFAALTAHYIRLAVPGMRDCYAATLLRGDREIVQVHPASGRAA
jgi:hypothetical protein